MTPLKRHAAVLEREPDLAAEEAIRLARECQLPEGEAMAPLVTLIGSEQVLELLLTPRSKPHNERPALDLFAGVRRLSHAAPRRADDQVACGRARMIGSRRSCVIPSTWSATRRPWRRRSVACTSRSRSSAGAGPTAGSPRVLAAPARTPSIAFGVGSAEAFEALVDRSKMRFTTGHEVAGWLAHTELRRLDWLVTSGAAAGFARSTRRSRSVRSLRRVHAVEAAPAMLELQMSSRAPSVAREWLGSTSAHRPRVGWSRSSPAPGSSPTPRATSSSAWRAVRLARCSRISPASSPTPTGPRLQQRVLDAALPADARARGTSRLARRGRRARQAQARCPRGWMSPHCLRWRSRAGASARGTCLRFCACCGRATDRDPDSRPPRASRRRAPRSSRGRSSTLG